VYINVDLWYTYTEIPGKRNSFNRLNRAAISSIRHNGIAEDTLRTGRFSYI